MNPVLADVPVVASERLGAYWVLTVRAPAIASGAHPGQFLNVKVDAAHLLRRPFSIYLVDAEQGTVSIAFDAIGEGTQWLAGRQFGDVVNIVGPLGSGFELPDEPEEVLLVGGGYGAAALAFLAHELRARRCGVHTIVGGRTAARVFDDPHLAQASASLVVKTDDGSAGSQGLVVEPIRALVARFGIGTVYACGPMPMLRAVAEEAGEIGVRAQLAVEEFMACGIGVCWTCVLPVQSDGAVAHARACTEGPVFEGAAVVWA